MPEWWGESAIKDEVAKYFPRCPFCLEKTVEGHRDNWSASDTATCSSCGAKWHLHHSLLKEKMQWAVLKKTGSKGNMDLLDVKHKPEFWRNMFLDNLKKRGKLHTAEKETITEDTVKEKEDTVKEKEVVVKFRRCPYCRNMYDENLSSCPNCGALAVKQLVKRITDKLDDVKKPK